MAAFPSPENKPPDNAPRLDQPRPFQSQEECWRDTPTTAGSEPIFPFTGKPGDPFPQAFGRYTLRRILGGGGMATVYLAFDQMLEIEVALKIPRPHVGDDPVLLQRFYREAKAGARLYHPQLCQVLDIGQF